MASHSDKFEHHGIKGQKWGVRRFQGYDGHLIKSAPKNTVELKNYKGKMYYITEHDFGSSTVLKPRVPNNFLTKYGYEDSETKRICFSDDPGRCLTALSQNVSGKTFNVYSPDDHSKHKIYKPNLRAVPDSGITNELWITEPTKVKKVGQIKCTGDDGKDGMKYTYGSNKAELYGWNWHWTKKKGSEVMSDGYSFEHHGIKGQRWGVRRYQNADGSLTDAGKRKYSKDLEKDEYKKYQEAYYNREKYSTKQLNEMNNRMNAEMNFRRNLENARPKKRSVEFGKKFAMGVAAVITAKATSELANYIYKSGRDYAIKAIVQGDTGMNELYSFEHHGIKGQKWGVRRTRQQLGYKIKNSKALGMYGGDRKKNREALKDMRTRMNNNKEGLNKVKSLDRASTVQQVLGNMFGGGVGIALHTASVADGNRARDAYTDVRSKAYEETKQKYGEDAANRALRHQKKVEQRVTVALCAAIVASTIYRYSGY